MSRPCTRVTALTCAAAVVLASAGVTATPAPASSTTGRLSIPGLQLLASDVTERGFGIATFGAAPSDTEVAALVDLGLRQPGP